MLPPLAFALPIIVTIPAALAVVSAGGPFYATSSRVGGVGLGVGLAVRQEHSTGELVGAGVRAAVGLGVLGLRASFLPFPLRFLSPPLSRLRRWKGLKHVH